MTEIMPVPKNCELLFYQQRASPLFLSKTLCLLEKHTKKQYDKM